MCLTIYNVVDGKHVLNETLTNQTVKNFVETRLTTLLSDLTTSNSKDWGNQI